MKMSIRIILVALLLSLLVANTAFASHGVEPVGSCPRGFMLEHMMMHEGHGEHHIGIAQDLNGDGWICMRHLSVGLHVHVDNYLPLP